MKNIAVISKYFAPENEISAVRPTKLIKYLKKSDEYFFTVITTEKPPDMIKDGLLKRDLPCANRVIRISEENNFSRFLSWIIRAVKTICGNYIPAPGTSISVKAKNGKFPVKANRGFLGESWAFLKFIAEYQKGLNYYRNVKKYLKEHRVGYDIIFSTYGPYATHWIGKYMKKQNPEAFWIADFRDGPVDDFAPRLFRRYCENYPKRICRNADLVTAVSQGVLDELALPDRIRGQVIPNGYDRDDIKGFLPRTPNEKMTFTYTGALYKGKRDLTPFFYSLNELMEQRLIDRSKIKLQYAGMESVQFIEQAALYHLNDIAVSYGNVEREHALRLQWESDILLLASWNRKGKTGIVTGKLLEYMMTGRPVLSLISGELPNSKIKEITEACRLGFCYEQATEGRDYVELKKYILEQYHTFLREGSVRFCPNSEEIEKYSYAKIAEKLESSFLE